jgi:hypothetical protein
MQRYHEFQPTKFDLRGLSLPERQNWLVTPVAHNRDSDTLTESNFKVVKLWLDDYDPEGHDHEVHRFTHWACGWFEIILVRPDSACATKATMIEDKLENYPILDEFDYSERENSDSVE